MSYRVRCLRCEYRNTYVTRAAASAAALRHRAMTEHEGIQVEDGANAADRHNGGDAEHE